MVMKTKENDERRRREHDDAQRTLQVQRVVLIYLLGEGGAHVEGAMLG